MRDLWKRIVVVLSCLSLLWLLLLTACPKEEESNEAVVKEGTPVHEMDSEGGKVAGGGGSGGPQPTGGR